MLPHYGQVGAGKAVLNFPQTAGLREIALPASLTHLAKHLILYNVTGDSLVIEGVIDGDTLICNTRFERDSITVAQICILRLYGSEMVAKHLCFNENRQIGIVERTPSGKIICTPFEPEQIEVIAVAVGMYRSFV